MPKIFVGEPFCAVFQKISGSEKVNGSERGGVSRFSVESYLSDSAEKFRGWGESFSVSFISGIDKVWIRGGEAVSRCSVGKFSVSQCRKI